MVELRMSEGEKFRCFAAQLAVLPPLIRKDLAGDERRLVGGEEHDGVGDLFRLRPALERDGGIERGFLVRRAGQPIEHAGLRRTGRDRVDADAEGCGLESGGLRQAFHGVFARRVERQVRGAALAHGRGNVDDAA
jgi:hypothetical protein